MELGGRTRLTEVALPVPVGDGVLTYALPEALWAGGVPGRRVLVPLRARAVTGVILSVQEAGSPRHELREVTRLVDDRPLLTPEVIALVRFAAAHYLYPLGLAIRGALPPGIELRERLSGTLTDEGRALTEGARTLFGLADSKGSEALARTRTQLRKLARGEELAPEHLRALEKRGLVRLERTEEAARVQAPRVELVEARPGADAHALARAPKQRAVLDWLLARALAVPVEELVAAFPGARGLLKKLEQRALVVCSSAGAGAPRQESAPWGEGGQPGTAAQRAALEQLAGALDGGGKTFLLHGVTGSGKTWVYLEAIAHARARGRGALVLVPEIALTPQLAGRFRARFGDDVAVLHSGLGDRERLGEWLRVLDGRAGIVVGARSAVFAPVRALGVVVVDEEHEPSYKSEERLRFHARDLALVRAQREGAVCVLGSATPSLETLRRAWEGKLALLSLPSRVDGRALPPIEIVDRKPAALSPQGPRLIGLELAAALRDTLAKGEQSILFLNRRGHARTLLCRSCGAAVGCPNCSVALVLHQGGGVRLQCHLCGHTEAPRLSCLVCGGQQLLPLSGGTERVEEELQALLPGARLGRLDRDAVASSGAAAALLARFARRELDVLAGTQMVAKGHDFPGVTLVGVLDADGPLHQPDFRAAERCLQLLLQVAGRAGRGERPGRVILQALRPGEPVLDAARAHDWLTFARQELERRRLLGFPPFARLCALLLEGNEEPVVEAAAARLGQLARDLAARGEPLDVLGPAPAPLARLRGKHRRQLLLRAQEHAPLRRVASRLVAAHALPGVSLSVDIDPLSFS